MIKLIKKLSEAHGVPGGEDEIRNIITKELEGICEISSDVMGNLVAKRGEGGKKIMLAAHMDEIGLMVRHIDESGFIKFITLGGFFDQTLLNQPVVVHTKFGRIPGVIGSKPPHLMEEKERDKVVKAKDMFIDVGAGDSEAAKKLGVTVGDYITFDMPFKELKSGLISGKSFDNRLGCAVMIEVMKKVKTNHTVVAVGTVQEEIGLKGARTSAYTLEPDVALALDVAPAGDFPGTKPEESRIKLGGGPVITVADGRGRGIITHPSVRDSLIAAADEGKIQYQLEVGDGGTTDATAIQLTRGGVLSGVVSVPTRYIHTPVEVAGKKDVEDTVKLVVAYIEGL
ncbi:MAG TPA: M42 family peptidase [Euryarchaeota archaeon]|nr:putative aminopeptidase YsdC [archaeon BMS3Abin16]GBE55847.1 putative aminopeptidase YsdC [archaeon BMS3Bbin16]HDH28352.1 M42 family peptidase [Euryarchaeota archaeon]HDY74512.1 M42 family peptidase [Euryarchaeota archaeon]